MYCTLSAGTECSGPLDVSRQVCAAATALPHPVCCSHNRRHHQARFSRPVSPEKPDACDEDDAACPALQRGMFGGMRKHLSDCGRTAVVIQPFKSSHLPTGIGCAPAGTAASARAQRPAGVETSLMARLPRHPGGVTEQARGNRTGRNDTDYNVPEQQASPFKASAGVAHQADTR